MKKNIITVILFGIYIYHQNTAALEINPDVFTIKQASALKRYLTAFDITNMETTTPQPSTVELTKDIAGMANRLLSDARAFNAKVKTIQINSEESDQENVYKKGTRTLTSMLAELQFFANGLLKQVKNLTSTQPDKQYDLNWCTCYKPSERIFFIIQLVLDIKKQFPNKSTKLIYTSLGSGGLLQDYLTLQELVRAGYNNITINIIDLSYPDITQLPATYNQRTVRYNEIKKTNQLVQYRLRKKFLSPRRRGAEG